jgi:hypothetical protein
MLLNNPYIKEVHGKNLNVWRLTTMETQHIKIYGM